MNSQIKAIYPFNQYKSSDLNFWKVKDHERYLKKDGEYNSWNTYNNQNEDTINIEL